jgi:Spy/CpxP family protein refolding chaperone
MYPGMIGWWKHAHRHGGPGDERGHEPCAGPGFAGPGYASQVECGPGGEGRGGFEGGRGRGGRGFGGFGGWGRGFAEEVFAGHGHHGHGPHGHGHDGAGDGGFGVRRPLRFLAYKLELEEAQVEELAAILNDLKTERAQGEVDQRRSTSGIAEAIAGETLDAIKLAAATDDRVKSAERLRDAVVKAIGRIHKILTAEQRTRFAYLIRTGALSI